ncbi:Mannose-6-phosphate isomerase [Mycena indigotica]|uniref:Mannose-6-phosphate isomerase n=1 Tax=Mycena indigotica TaxID=2126181 RepID=A0A8H6WB18_9AGAR|nr:Mannose-6-phosphate isomerase [Mycena indigotica]KAF7309751.1 Mannose-6-phosphate isomerase [Mycena indigotica]
MSVFKILPTAQQYDWGKIGSSSKVAQFATRIPGFKLDESAPYAELWMGTHPKSPSLVANGNTALSDHLAANPGLIGNSVATRFDATGGNLPFLFKVLAIEKALSIQTHPDKKTAEVLFVQQPDIYKDDNHKPEMALALTPFAALCGFMPLPRIAAYFRVTPELVSLVPPSIVAEFLALADSSTPHGPEEKVALRNVFSAVMTAEPTLVKSQLDLLVARYQSRPEDVSSDTVDLVLRLNSQFPGDIGIFCAFLLNYVHLNAGEAIFLGAGEPHAYVYGDIMECMANSDNVIRAGLTPKLRDIPNLVAGLTYEAADPARHVVKPTSFHGTTASTLYDPPIPEFSVVQVSLAGSQETHPPLAGPSIAIVTEGNCTIQWKEGQVELKQGEVAFIGANAEVSFASKDRLTLYRAFVE